MTKLPTDLNRYYLVDEMATAKVAATIPPNPFYSPAPGQVALNCPTCNRPMAAKGDDSITAVPEGSEAYQDAIALEFVKVAQTGVQNEQDRVKKLLKIYRFERRETTSQDERED
jgi:hypothetical protein